MNPAAVAYTHLHVHSNRTLLGGTASVEALAGQAAAEGMSYLALTDTNALYGAIRFDRACRKEGVQPIIGMTLTVASPFLEHTGISPTPALLTLLAVDRRGYRSLCRLSTAIQGRSDRIEVQRRGVSLDLLAEHREGVICLSGGRRGWLERWLRAGEENLAARYAGRLAGIFDENTYLALELHRQADRVIAQQVTDLGNRFGLPTVAVQPVYCLHPQQRPLLRLLAAIDRNCPLSAVPAEALPDQGDDAVSLHWLSAAEMAERFRGFEPALARTQDIARSCRPALPDGSPIWPVLDLPAGQTPDEALAQMATEGCRKRYGHAPDPLIQERLQRELAAITRHGFSPLFLLVADVVRFARSHAIPVSTRGSVANSLVAYCTGITTVDPIAHQLLFERFLNPARTDPPDIDLDFCSRRRDEVLDYVRRTYGADRVALVATISTMRPKSAVRETAKAYGLGEEEIKELTQQLPRGWHPDPRRRSKTTLADFAQGLQDERQRSVLAAAMALIGQPHHLSVHPGAVVIAPGPLTDYAPLQLAPKGFLITQYDHIDVEAAGFTKIDFLGIQALTVLADAAEMVRTFHDPSFRIEQIPADDPATAQILAKGETVGIFQCESSGAQRTLRQLRAQTVADLAIANAFFKPGPAMGGMARHFIRRYRGVEPVSYLHPALEPILRRTQGVLIFQEQILRVATEIAGLSWAQANQLRRGMSKFRSQELAALQSAFLAGCQRPPPAGPGMSENQARTLWEQVRAFSGYGFNQGHATAYADVSYRSAYLKAHYPAEFFCARLGGWGGFHHPAIYMAEAKRLGIAVRPPHVNHSQHRFTLTWAPGPNGQPHPCLWMGLGQVRDLRRRSVQAIVSEREKRPFSDVRDLLQRVPLHSKEVLHLIQCGALDGLGQHRNEMLALVGMAAHAGSARQMSFDFMQEGVLPETLSQRLAWERQLLGQPMSAHPLDLVQPLLADAIPLRELAKKPGEIVRTAAVRLPGWTGGKGFFLGDGDTYVVAIGDENKSAPPVWKPLMVGGRWRWDEWGGGWLQVEEIAPAWEDV